MCFGYIVPISVPLRYVELLILHLFTTSFSNHANPESHLPIVIRHSLWSAGFATKLARHVWTALVGA